MLTLERSPKGWLLSSTDYDKIVRLTSKQVRELFLKLNNERFDDIFLPQSHPEDLMIVMDKDYFCIRRYFEIKNRPYIVEIKKKVDKELLKRMIKNTNKNLKDKGIKILVVPVSLTNFLYLISSKINSGEFNLNISNEEQFEEYDEYDDYEIVKEELTLDDLIREEVNDKQNDIKKYMENYGELFSISLDTQESLLISNETYLLSTDNIESEVINMLADYYFNNMYDQVPIIYNDADDYNQMLTIIRYANIREITDEEVLTTMLAVHELETDRGNSEDCRNYNNLGGIFISSEIKKYPNLDVGAIDYVNVFLRVMNKALSSESYDESKSIEYNMNPIYGAEKMNSNDLKWTEQVKEIKDEIKASGLLEKLLNDNNLK